MEEIKTETTTKIEGRAGNLYIEAHAADDGLLKGNVTVSAGTANDLEIDPELLERAAILVEKMRREVMDLRRVCVEHGYHAGYDCKLCNPPKIEATPTPTPAVDDPAF